jgi:hypothetical protein
VLADRIEARWIDLFGEVFGLAMYGTTVVENGKLAGELA